MRKYLNRLGWATVKGVSHAVVAFAGLATGHSLAPDIPVLNFKALGVVIVTSAIVSLFRFVDETPAPTEDTKNNP